MVAYANSGTVETVCRLVLTATKNVVLIDVAVDVVVLTAVVVLIDVAAPVVTCKVAGGRLSVANPVFGGDALSCELTTTS